MKMMKNKVQVLLFICKNCKGMTDKLLPEIQLHFSHSLKVLPVTCPSQIDPFVYIKLLKKSCDGIIMACPKDACCCPENKKVIKRREIVKDMLPIFGLDREKFQVASVSPFYWSELMNIVKQMMALIKTENQNLEETRYLFNEDDYSNSYKWLN